MLVELGTLWKLFVTMSHMRYQIPKFMTDSCADSYGRLFFFWCPSWLGCDKWWQFGLLYLGFGHARMKTFGYPSCRQCLVQTIIKFAFRNSGQIEGYESCDNFTTLAKLGTLWTISRHPCDGPNLSLDAQFLCRIVWRFFCYPSWPHCANTPKTTTGF